MASILPPIDLKSKPAVSYKKYQRISSEPSARMKKYRTPLTVRNSEHEGKVINELPLKKQNLSYNQDKNDSSQALIIKEKVWLIRKIGELICEDTQRISITRKKMKKNVDYKFKHLKRSADKLMNMINEEGNRVDGKDVRRLR